MMCRFIAWNDGYSSEWFTRTCRSIASSVQSRYSHPLWYLRTEAEASCQRGGIVSVFQSWWMMRGTAMYSGPFMPASGDFEVSRSGHDGSTARYSSAPSLSRGVKNREQVVSRRLL